MLIPATMENLDGPHTSLAHTTSEEAGVGKGSRLEGFGAVEIEDVFWFVLEVGELGNAGLHSAGHFILQAACDDFVIVHAGMIETIQLRHAVHHGTTEFARNAGGIGKVKNGVT